MEHSYILFLIYGKILHLNFGKFRQSYFYVVFSRMFFRMIKLVNLISLSF